MGFDVAFLWSTFVKLGSAVPMTLGLFAASVSLGALFAPWHHLLPSVRRIAAVGLWPRLRLRVPWLAAADPDVPHLLWSRSVPAVRHSLFWPVLRDPFSCAVLALAPLYSRLSG